MRRRIALDIHSAVREIASKTDAEIERETAAKWAARAVACYREYARSGMPVCSSRPTDIGTRLSSTQRRQVITVKQWAQCSVRSTKKSSYSASKRR